MIWQPDRSFRMSGEYDVTRSYQRPTCVCITLVPDSAGNVTPHCRFVVDRHMAVIRWHGAGRSHVQDARVAEGIGKRYAEAIAEDQVFGGDGLALRKSTNGHATEALCDPG